MPSKSYAAIFAPFLLLSSWSTLVSASRIVYLDNCSKQDSAFSQMAFYGDVASSHDLQFPDVTAHVSDQEVQWEGNRISGSFPDGTTFEVSISGDGGQAQAGAFVGPGADSNTPFNCFKDTGRRLYSSNGYDCFSIYWCTDVSGRPVLVLEWVRAHTNSSQA